MIRASLKRIENLVWQRAAYKFALRSWHMPGDIDTSRSLIATMKHLKVVEPVVLDTIRAKRILVIAPHPDDEAIGCGGTILKAIASGSTVHVVYLTDGFPADRCVREAQDAARLAGYTQTFLGHSMFDIPDEAADDLSAIIREMEPEIILVPFFLDDHADHMRSAQILALANLPKCEIWCYQVYGMVPGNLLVDITDVSEEKAELIRCWNPGSRDWAHYALGQNAFQCRALRRGGKSYAESFFAVPSREYSGMVNPPLTTTPA